MKEIVTNNASALVVGYLLPSPSKICNNSCAIFTSSIDAFWPTRHGAVVVARQRCLRIALNHESYNSHDSTGSKDSKWIDSPRHMSLTDRENIQRISHRRIGRVCKPIPVVCAKNGKQGFCAMFRLSLRKSSIDSLLAILEATRVYLIRKRTYSMEGSKEVELGRSEVFDFII